MPVARQMIADAYGSKGHELVFVVENLEKQTVINGHKVISESYFLSCQADNKYFNIAIANGCGSFAFSI